MIFTLSQSLQAQICTACRLSRCRPSDERCGLVKAQRARNRGYRPKKTLRDLLRSRRIAYVTIKRRSEGRAV